MHTGRHCQEECVSFQPKAITNHYNTGQEDACLSPGAESSSLLLYEIGDLWFLFRRRKEPWVRNSSPVGEAMGELPAFCS